MRLVIFAAVAAAFVLSPAAAQTPVPVAAFDSIELRGGGHVAVRPGPRQRVTLVRGDAETTRFTVDRDGTLRIDACVRPCRDYRLEVEIVTPDLNGVAVSGGGAVRAGEGFPDGGRLAVAVSGGGSIDVGAIRSGSVAASVRGGGAIRTHARDSLTASVSGGGSIRYLGDPRVTSSINGGGAVSPAGR